MKLWKIGLYICCVLILLYWFFYINKEGFTAPPSAFTAGGPVPPVTTYNVSYSGKYVEAFLLIPNVPNLPSFVPRFTDTLNADGTAALNNYAANKGINDTDYELGKRTFYSDAFTLQEAEQACKDFGATLATPGQLEIAAQLDGYWVPASWASDGQRYALIPENMANHHKNTMKWTINASGSPSSHNPLRIFKTGSLPASGPNPITAFPVCWGVKPAQPAEFIVDFNQTEPSMFSAGLISSVINPKESDLLQTSFTPDQAVYALQQTNYNINDGGTNPARKFLIGNSPTTGFAYVNEKIYKEAVGQDQYNEDRANFSIDNPCEILLTTFNKFHNQFDTLRQLMRTVNGGVIAMERAKQENSNFQMDLQTVCEVESPTTSPACARLATIDYDILYNTDNSDISTTRIATLELLNYNLFLREGELCQAMQNLFIFQNMMSCQRPNNVPADCVCESKKPEDIESSGSNSDKVPVEPTLCSSTDPDYSWSMNGLQPNNVGYLKILLQQISPYFGVATYKTLIENVIRKLSIMIDMPNLNDFNKSNDNFKAVERELEIIRSFLEYNTQANVV